MPDSNIARADLRPSPPRAIWLTDDTDDTDQQKTKRTGPYKHLVTVVSFMLPFNVTGTVVTTAMLFLLKRALACVEPAAVASAASCRGRRLMLEFQVLIR